MSVFTQIISIAIALEEERWALVGELWNSIAAGSAAVML